MQTVKILESDFPQPYNLLSLPDGESIEFIATGYRVGPSKREVVSLGKHKIIEGPMMRIMTDLNTPVRGAPYVDVLSTKAVALLEAHFKNTKFPVKIRLTARGVEPNKWYEVEISAPGK